jgi:hypothetical protein
MGQIVQQYQTFDSRIVIEVQRHNGSWSDAESAFVHPKEDPAAKIRAMSARIAWYRETNPKLTYRLVHRLKVTDRQTTLLDEVPVETGSALTVPDDPSALG